jgi:hypothetical protein
MCAIKAQLDLTAGERMLRARGVKRARLIADERRHSPRWFFLSFANEHQFLGAAIVRAHGLITAVERASSLGIMPGGDVEHTAILRKDIYRVPLTLRNRLLSEAEVRAELDGKGAGEE